MWRPAKAMRVPAPSQVNFVAREIENVERDIDPAIDMPWRLTAQKWQRHPEQNQQTQSQKSDQEPVPEGCEDPVSVQSVEPPSGGAQQPVASLDGLRAGGLRERREHLLPRTGQRANRPIAAEHEAVRAEVLEHVRHEGPQVLGFPGAWIVLGDHAGKF